MLIYAAKKGLHFFKNWNFGKQFSPLERAKKVDNFCTFQPISYGFMGFPTKTWAKSAKVNIKMIPDEQFFQKRF